VNRTARLVLFALSLLALAPLLVRAVDQMPAFGTTAHAYRDHAVPAALAQHTSNVVSSVNYDQRAFDTLGEETLLLAGVAGAAALLRPGSGERLREPPSDVGRVLPSTVLLGYLFLPITALIGIDVVAHGALSPGGGFQGGVVVATGVHLLYVAGSYRVLERLRPLRPFTLAEALGAAGFVGVGLAGALGSVAFAANLMPTGRLGALASAGTVPVLSALVGVEVAAGFVVLLAAFLTQTLRVRPADDDAAQPGPS
jgi:multicomponent Na+:H+ antiporter subunit B